VAWSSQGESYVDFEIALLAVKRRPSAADPRVRCAVDVASVFGQFGVKETVGDVRFDFRDVLGRLRAKTSFGERLLYEY
jgi:hypothetical protein